MCVLLLVGVAAAPATQPATSPATSQAAAVGMLFTPPPNWQKVERDGLTIYVAPGAKEGGSTAIVLWPAGKIERDYKVAFDDLRKDARGDFDPLRQGEVKSFRNDAGYDCLSVQEVLQDRAGRKSLRTYLAVRQGDRMEACMYVADTLEGFSAHAKEADAFMSSMRFAPTTQPVSRPAR
jgi:hypothetical protein